MTMLRKDWARRLMGARGWGRSCKYFQKFAVNIIAQYRVPRASLVVFGMAFDDCSSGQQFRKDMRGR